MAQKAPELFELKSASLSLLSLVLHTADPVALAADMRARLGDSPFDGDAVMVDLSQLRSMPDALGADDEPAKGAQMSLQEVAPDLNGLLAVLRSFGLRPLAAAGAQGRLAAEARNLGLVDAPLGQRAEAPAPREVVREVIREVVREVPVPVEVPVAASAAEAPRTIIIDKPLRSGQQVYAKGADLVVMALVNHGAEVIADGNIHVYAPLRGKVIAGARGNTEARIFAVSLEAELIAIAGIYRTSENPLPAEVRGKPAQVRLEGEKLVMEALSF